MKAKPSESVEIRFETDVKQIRKDLSGVVLADDGTLWLASDEVRSIERLKRDDGRFEGHASFGLEGLLKSPTGKEFDIEGLDLDGGCLWAVGGYGAARQGIDAKDLKKGDAATDRAKEIRGLAAVDTKADRRFLARLPISGGKPVAEATRGGRTLTASRLASTTGDDLLLAALAGDEHIGPFIRAGVPSKDNGLDVEALAVVGDRVFVGLRGPVLRGWAVLLEIQVHDAAPGVLGLDPIGAGGRPYLKHFVFMEGLGFRDICREGSDFLILAGPSTLLDGPARVYRLPNAVDLRENRLHVPTEVLELPHGRGDDHPEGMTLAGSLTGRPSILVVYDSPSKDRLPGQHRVLADVFKLP